MLNVQLPWPTGRTAQLVMSGVLFSYIPSALGVREPRWLGHVRFAVIAALVLIIGLDTLVASPSPRIDVWELQQKAVDLLKQGKNPYQDLAVRERGWGTLMPFVYPPTVIYTGFFARVFFGDIRYSNLLAIVMTGLALRSITRRAQVPLPAIGLDAPALFFWLQPKLFLVLEQAWIDVIQLGFLTAGLALFLGRLRLLGVILMGIAISSKQTMFWFLPLILLFLNFRRRDWVALFATCAVPCCRSWLGLSRAPAIEPGRARGPPPRRDALTSWPGTTPSTRTGVDRLGRLDLVAGGAGAGRLELRGSLPAFGLSATAIYFLFFFFQKWAFANYYFFVAGLAALAAALSLHGSPVRIGPAAPRDLGRCRPAGPA